MSTLKYMNKFSKFSNGKKLYNKEIDVRFNSNGEPQKIMGVSIVKTFVDEADLILCKPILKDVK